MTRQKLNYYKISHNNLFFEIIVWTSTEGGKWRFAFHPAPNKNVFLHILQKIMY